MLDKIKLARLDKCGTCQAWTVRHWPGWTSAALGPRFSLGRFWGKHVDNDLLTHYFRIKQGINLRIYTNTSADGCFTRTINNIKWPGQKREFFQTWRSCSEVLTQTENNVNQSNQWNENGFKDLLEKELEAVGIRLNKRKPDIYFKVKICIIDESLDQLCS